MANTDSEEKRDLVVLLDVNGTVAPFDGKISFADYCVLVVADRTFYPEDAPMTEEFLLTSFESGWEFVFPGLESVETALNLRRRIGASLAQRAKDCSLFGNKGERLVFLKKVCTHSPSCARALKMLSDSCPDRALFPGVLVLLGMLRSLPNARVVLRTFGTDAEEVLPIFASALGLPGGANGVPSYKMIHSWTGAPILSSPASGLEWHQPSTITHQLSLYRLSVVQDDWKPWNHNQEARRCGKPFFLGAKDEAVVFFDDNVRDAFDPEDCELVNVVRPLSVADGSALSVRDCLQSGSVVRVDRFRAMTEANYFVDRLPH